MYFRVIVAENTPVDVRFDSTNAKCHFLSFELSILEEIKDQTKVNCLFLIAKTDEETLKWAQNLNAKW